MLVRLRDSGFIEVEKSAIDHVDTIPNTLTKRARLVYVGDFEASTGPVKVTEEHLKKIVANYNGRLSKFKRLAVGSPTISMMPPVQLDHTRSARDTVGRLESDDLVLEDWIDEDGEKRKALYANVRILGRENVERVLDGRWSNLSIGADFDDGRLEELTVTPFPAASNAHLLARQQMGSNSRSSWEFSYKGTGWRVWQRDDLNDFWVESDGGKKVTVHIGNYNPHTSDQEIIAAAKRSIDSKARFSSKKEDDKDDKEELESDDDDDKKELSEEEKKKKEEEEEEEEKKKKEKADKMAAAKTAMSKLSSDFTSKRTSARLAAKSAIITSLLSSIRASGRISPAEMKKIDVKELASKSDEAVAAVLKSYEDRQPVILTGQLGSMKPMTIKELRAETKERTMTQLEIETRRNMSLLAHTVPKDADKLQSETEAIDNVQHSVDNDPKQDMEAMERDYSEICSMIDSARYGEVKERLKSFMERLQKNGAYGLSEPTFHDQAVANMASVESDIEELSKKFEEAMRLAESFASGD